MILGRHAGFVYKLSTRNVADFHAGSEASRPQLTVVEREILSDTPSEKMSPTPKV